MKKPENKLWQGILILLENFLIQLRLVFYVVFIIFLIFGLIALFTGGVGLGIVLVVLNVVLLFVMRRIDKASDEKSDRYFEEIVRKNRVDQDPTGGRRTK